MAMPWEFDLILAIQRIPGLTGIMVFFASFVSEEFLLFTISTIYWCFDSRLGIRMAAGLIASNSLVDLAKLVFHLPRPYWVGQRVQAWSSEGNYGLPSGHTIISTTVFGVMASWFKKGWIWGIAIFCVFMIALSRIYLGVHFPGDVAAGFIFGILLLVAWWRFERPLVAWHDRLPLGRQVFFWVAFSLIFLALFAGVLAWIAPVPDPVVWAQNASLVAGSVPINPRDPSRGVTDAGLLLGFGLGVVLNKHRPTGFLVEGTPFRRILRLFMGLAGVVLIWGGIKAVTPAEPILLALAFRYIRYTLMILWAFYLAPLVFVKFKL